MRPARRVRAICFCDDASMMYKLISQCALRVASTVRPVFKTVTEREFHDIARRMWFQMPLPFSTFPPEQFRVNTRPEAFGRVSRLIRYSVGKNCLGMHLYDALHDGPLFFEQMELSHVILQMCHGKDAGMRIRPAQATFLVM